MSLNIEQRVANMWDQWHAETKLRPPQSRLDWIREATEMSIAIDRQIADLHETRVHLMDAVLATMRDMDA